MWAPVNHQNLLHVNDKDAMYRPTHEFAVLQWKNMIKISKKIINQTQLASKINHRLFLHLHKRRSDVVSLLAYERNEIHNKHVTD